MKSLFVDTDKETGETLSKNLMYESSGSGFSIMPDELSAIQESQNKFISKFFTNPKKNSFLVHLKPKEEYQDPLQAARKNLSSQVTA